MMLLSQKSQFILLELTVFVLATQEIPPAFNLLKPTGHVMHQQV